MTGPLPEILEQPLIPRPLHGVNPRSIMGQAAWDRMRKEIYRKHSYCCAACGVKSRQAMIRPYLEAHEMYTIDWKRQEMILIGMEPLCHACHAFVHSGLLELRLHHGKISSENVARILGNGVGVLEEINGTMPIAANYLCRKLGLKHGLPVVQRPPAARWSGWKLIWNGSEYPSPYPTENHWARAMKKQNLN